MPYKNKIKRRENQRKRYWIQKGQGLKRNWRKLKIDKKEGEI